MNRGKVSPRPEFAVSYQYSAGAVVPPGMSAPALFSAAGNPTTAAIAPQGPMTPPLILLTAAGAT